MPKFKNLEAEMIRSGIDYNNIADKLDITSQTVKRKLKGDIGTTISEAKIIQGMLKENHTIDYLFEEEK